ncbi:hypothetical protein PGT21_003365 [Puccinia graminis f. sp. tritici]|uniref:Uncharacterized protein n=1 Tax=Puccinia graminis f. sp. tritici TaxID=56615 RepID=A0A5B0LUX4_PUCGR|nr:hypothetical protein PGT21_003365 [Puccinia graminis f. sp. tritici]
MLTSGPPHRGSSICTCHWRLSEDRLGTPRSGFQPLLSQNNHQHQAHHCQIVVIASSAENRHCSPYLSPAHLAAKWVCPCPYSEGQQLTDVISSSANNQQATAPPPSSPQAPNNSNPSALADGIELVPPSTQPPLENERTWVHLSTSTRHPPSSPQAPILLLERLFLSGWPPTTRSLLPRPTESTISPPTPSCLWKTKQPGSTHRPRRRTPPPPFSPQAPNHLKPSASANGIDHLPPYTQLPLENETTRAPNHLKPSASADGIDHLPPFTQLPLENDTTRVDLSTSATHPPILSPGPQPPEAFCLGRRNRPSPPLHPAAFGKRHDPGRPIDLGDAPPLLSPGPQPPA